VASNDSGVIENVDFRDFGRYVFGTLGNEASIIIQYFEATTAKLKKIDLYCQRQNCRPVNALFSDA